MVLLARNELASMVINHFGLDICGIIRFAVEKPLLLWLRESGCVGFNRVRHHRYAVRSA